LQSRGLVSTSKENGAKVVKVTPLFYDYFDVDKQEFKDIKDTIKEEVTKEDNTIEYKGN
jgi:chromosome segregation and condensation protein ScpB